MLPFFGQITADGFSSLYSTQIYGIMALLTVPREGAVKSTTFSELYL